ncbi:hypothetical protein [Trinickia dinghuensis]|uniref:hypothetical protein n=1 Tax=Trinickia dinghuensis TaxID=2291023 RepID=UPI0011C02260|nr:hypothetical protein [Trinickia dinghuensis]
MSTVRLDFLAFVRDVITRPAVPACVVRFNRCVSTLVRRGRHIASAVLSRPADACVTTDASIAPDADAGSGSSDDDSGGGDPDSDLDEPPNVFGYRGGRGPRAQYKIDAESRAARRRLRHSRAPRRVLNCNLLMPLTGVPDPAELTALADRGITPEALQSAIKAAGLGIEKRKLSDVAHLVEAELAKQRAAAAELEAA